MISNTLQLGAPGTMTNEWNDQSFGAQYMCIISGIVFAAVNNLYFIYTPMHRFCGNNDPEFVRKKEELINVIDQFPLNRDLALQRSQDRNFQNFFDNNTDLCTNHPSFQRIQNWFFERKDKSKYYNNDNLHIAIHVRRAQENEGGPMHFHFSDKIYLKMIESLRKKYSSCSPLFHIFSLGDVEHFQKTYGANDVVLHINESIEDTFTAMTFADVLLIAASGFSYTAGLLSKGTVYHIPYWHGPKPSWINWETLYPLNLPRWSSSMGSKDIRIDI